MTNVVFVAVMLVLCQCASKHQPIEFAPHFPTRPETQLEPASLAERNALEGKAATPTPLSVLEKKRLIELYTLEMKGLKATTPRHVELTATTTQLAAELGDVDRDLPGLSAKAPKYREIVGTPEAPRANFTIPELRRAWLDAHRLWNKDQVPEAWQLVGEMVRNEEWKKKASKAEWLKVLRLQYRIALELNDLPSARAAVEEMAALDKCGTETTEAGFLIALHLFSAGDKQTAINVFDGQCDRDESATNQMRRHYWAARFREGVDDAESARRYDEVLRSRMPGYYVYLAASHLGRKIEVASAETEARTYLTGELSMSAEVHDLLLNAEARLKANLRKDATLYLLKASYLLRDGAKSARLYPLLYTAHLFEAAAAHLEAMKIYAVVTNLLNESSDLSTMKIDFLHEMFPRPFEGVVESLSKQWGADPDFIYAIMRQESAFNPGAVSSADARGLMQLMPSLARQLSQQWSYGLYSDRLLFDAEENLKISTFHISRLRQQAPHLVLMAASYNAGLARTSGWWKRMGQLPLDVFVELIPINETRNYAKLVLRNYIYYKALRSGGQLDSSIIPFQLPPYKEVSPAFLARRL